MHALSFQLSAFSIGLLLMGLGAGWWVAQFFQKHSRTACYQELVRLRYAHQRLQQDFTELMQKKIQCEAEKQEIIIQLNQSADLKNFEQLRSQLMHTRNQLHHCTNLLTKREHQLRRLTDLAKLLRQQIRIPLQVANQTDLKLAITHHELSCIEGIDSSSIQKLHMLGILNCEQLAACSTEQLKLIQRLLSEDRILPLAKWVKAARLLADTQSSTNSLAN